MDAFGKEANLPEGTFGIDRCYGGVSGLRRSRLGYRKLRFRRDGRQGCGILLALGNEKQSRLLELDPNTRWGFRHVESYLTCIKHGLAEGFSGFTWDLFYKWMSEGNEALFEKELPLSWMERYTYIQQRQIYMKQKNKKSPLKN